MTHDEIMKLEAGVKLDALIAEHVMGWTWQQVPEEILDGPRLFGENVFVNGREMKQSYHPFYDGYDDIPRGGADLPHYSTDIAAAWQVVEKMRSKDPFNAGARFAEELAQMTDANQDDYMADAFNLIMNLSPLAICRAALLAVMDSRP